MTNVNSEIVERLKSASANLLFMSESEFPFEVFLWESPDKTPLSPAKVLKHTNHPQDTPVEVATLDDFFRVAVTEQDWYGEEEKETVKRFQTLVETIKTHLSNPQVYRLGTVEIDIYIIGQTPLGDSAGLSTKVVET